MRQRRLPQPPRLASRFAGPRTGRAGGINRERQRNNARVQPQATGGVDVFRAPAKRRRLVVEDYQVQQNISLTPNPILFIMKKLFLSLLLAAALPFAVLAQAPQKFNYQAVARDAAGDVLASQTVDVKLSVNDGSANGTTVYSETHD